MSAQSYKVGYTVEHGAARNVYEALQAIECFDCEREIKRGENFTRHKRTGGGPALYPVCSTCEPISEVRDDYAKRAPDQESFRVNPTSGPPLGSL